MFEMKKWSTERIARTSLWLIVGVATIVFALFFAVGYDHPSDDNADFNAPRLISAVLILQYVLLAVAVVVLAVAVVRSLRMRSESDNVVNDIPATRIAVGVVAGTAGLLVLTFLFGSSATLTINGQPYTDSFWLKVADMFVGTSLWLLVAAIVAVGYGATRYVRRGKRTAQEVTHK